MLAVADEDDADLLGAHGEADANRPARAATPAPSEDFAARLEFSDEVERQSYSDIGARPSPNIYDPPSGGYTVAEHDPGGQELDFDEPHAFSRREEPHVYSRREEPDAVPRRDSDLEKALSALDVDLDDFSAAREGSKPVALPGLPVHRGTSARKEPAQPTVRGVSAKIQRPGKPRRLPTEDDGVLIDFDDDE